MAQRYPVVEGVVPAIYTTFKNDRELSLDEAALARLTEHVVSADGVGGVFCTGHAGEVAALSTAEQERVIRVVASTVNKRVPVLAGIYSDNLEECIDLSRLAKRAGADVVTIFPPRVLAGVMGDKERVYKWFEAIAKRSEMPICVFLYPAASGIGYTTETLLRLADLPEVVAVKEGSGSPKIYEDHVLALSALPDPVKVLTTNNDWWLADLAFAGGDGILSGSGPVLAKQQVEIYRAIKRGDLLAARKVHESIRPLIRAFYKTPAIEMHNRMKVALTLMGVLPHAAVRPPLEPIGKAEIDGIQKALEAAGMLDAAAPDASKLKRAAS